MALEVDDSDLLSQREWGMMIEMLLLDLEEEAELVVLRALGREDAEDGALFLERQLWLEIRRGIGRLDS